MTTSTEIATYLGTSIELDVAIEGVSTADQPRPHTLAFVVKWTPERQLAVTQAATTLFLLPLDAPAELPNGIRVSSPRLDFARVGVEFFSDKPAPGIHPTAVVSPSATISASAHIGPYAVIEDRVQVGDGSVIGPHVTLERGVRVGRNSAIGSHTCVGSAGFGFEREADGTAYRLAHLGSVVIGDDVEIGAHVTISRGTIEDTVIGNGAKIDNHVFIAHNARIDDDVFLIAGALICGSAHIQARSWVAPGAVVKNKVTVGADATVGLGAVVVRDVPDGVTVAGVPAKPLGS